MPTKPVDQTDKKKTAPKPVEKPVEKPPVEKPVEKPAAKKMVKKPAAKKTTKKSVKKTTRKAKSTKKTTKKDMSKPEVTIELSSGPVVRYFKVVYNGEDAHGRYSGSKPKQAANKALTSILKAKSTRGESTDDQVKFSIVECTRGSKHKQYNYIGERIELEKPMAVPIKTGTEQKTIIYKYNNRVMKDKST